MKEIPLAPLLKTVTLPRIVNAGKGLASYLLSALLQKPIVWGKPFILTVEPTNICNLACPLCVTGNKKMTRQAGLMDFDTFKAIVDETGKHLFYLLLYQQGEPFLNKAIFSFIKYAKAQNIFVTTSTNGHYFDAESAQRVVASGLDSLIVSIDGADQSTYETYRVGGKLSRVIEGIRNLMNERERLASKTPRILLQFILMKQNEHQIKDIRRLARDLRVDRLLIKTVQVENVDEAQKWLPETASFRRYKFDGQHLRPRTRGRGPCPRPWTSSLVNWDGSVVPCCFDKNGHHTFGSLKTQNEFEDIWQSEDYAHFRDKMLRDRQSLRICSNCSQGLRLYL